MSDNKKFKVENFDYNGFSVRQKKELLNIQQFLKIGLTTQE